MFCKVILKLFYTLWLKFLSKIDPFFLNSFHKNKTPQNSLQNFRACDPALFEAVASLKWSICNLPVPCLLPLALSAQIHPGLCADDISSSLQVCLRVWHRWSVPERAALQSWTAVWLHRPKKPPPQTSFPYTLWSGCALATMYLFSLNSECTLLVFILTTKVRKATPPDNRFIWYQNVPSFFKNKGRHKEATLVLITTWGGEVGFKPYPK